jgi:glycosyltransferase involved in cell wall biosynthesis
MKKHLKSNSRNKRILVIASYDKSLVNFRYDLLKSFSKKNCDVAVCAPNIGEKIEGQLKQIRVKSINWAVNRNKVNITDDIASIISLFKIVRKFRPDILFCYTIKPILFSSIIGSIYKKPKIYSMFTGLGKFLGADLVKKHPKSAVFSLLKFFLRTNHKIIFQNLNDQRLLKTKYLIGSNTKSVCVNGSGINLSRFKFNIKIKKKIRILMASRIIKEKGVLNYLEAAKIITANNTNIEFLLYGDTDNDTFFFSQERIKKISDSYNVSYCGYVNDIRPILAKISVYILPTYYPEGTPMGILEAMASGCAIITTNTPGCKECVIHGLNGYLIKPNSTKDLVNAIQNLIRTPDLISKMGFKSREIAEEKYNVRDVNKVMLKEMGIN